MYRADAGIEPFFIGFGDGFLRGADALAVLDEGSQPEIVGM